MYSKYAKLRDKKGFSDYRVAKETGIATSTFAEWKKGTYTPKLEKLTKIADFFGVPIDYFIKGKKA